MGGFDRAVRLSLGVILVSTALLLLNPGGPPSVAGALDETGQVGSYLLLAIAWAAYGAVHSAMISETATGFLKRRLGAAFRYYRLFFNLAATGLLVPVVSYSMSLRRGPVLRWDGPWLVLRFTLVAAAVLLFVTGGRHYSLGQFIGISQLRGTSSGGLAAGGGIDSTGVLGVIRHPWYAGLVLLLWARDLDVGGLVVSSVLTVYILVGTLLEERKLVHEFGDAYRSYQRRVSMFVPVRRLRLVLESKGRSLRRTHEEPTPREPPRSPIRPMLDTTRGLANRRPNPAGGGTIMPTPQKVLVATDLSEASRTPLGYAAALSRRLGASLTALYVSPRYASYEPFPAFPSQAALDPARRQGLEDEVRLFVESAAGAPPVEVVVRDGDPADEILAAAGGSAFDLVVLGTHGRRGFERWSLGSVTDRVARRLEQPLLTVPPHADPPAAARMLCALDLSAASAGVLAYAAGLAERLEARLLVLNVAEGSHWYDPWPISGVDPDAVRRAVVEEAERRLADLVGRQVPGEVPVEVKVAFGSAQREIERVAREEADMVILGVPSTRGIDRLFFGSTAQHVLRAGICPVLLVRHAPAA